MKPEPSREEALFKAAAQLIGAERAVFLNGACHGDSSLRQRLEARLSAHEQPDSMPVTRGEVTLSTMKMEFPDGTADQAVGQTLGRLPRQRGWALAGVVRNR